MCKAEEERVCYEQVIDELKKDQGEHCKKSCNSKEFQTQSVIDGLKKKIGKSNWAKWKKENWDWNGSHPENSFIFEYTFGVPSDVRDLRSERPYKTVNTEYLVVSPMSLIGNVGGAMGMFVGFSFIGCSELFIKAADKARVWFSGLLVRSYSLTRYQKSANCYPLKIDQGFHVFTQPQGLANYLPDKII